MIRSLLCTMILLLTSTLLLANEDQFTPPDEPFESSLVKTQHLLSTAVDSVSTISGEWIQSETDFVVSGPEPLILNRCYSGDHAHDDRLGYNWDFNRPHKLIIDIEDEKTQHAKALARLYHSSGVATIHESSVRREKLEKSIIPLLLSRTRGLTNCRGEINAKTNLHNTVVHLDLKGKQCAAITGSGLVTYYDYSHEQNITQWREASIGIGHYKIRTLHHYRPVYERKPNGNTLHFEKGIISASNSNRTQEYGHIKFHNEGIETLKVEASDGKWGTYHFSLYYHPLKRSSGQLAAFFKHRFYLSKANFSHKPSITYEYTHSPPSQSTENPKNPLLRAIRQPNGRFQEVEYYTKGSNTIEMRSDQKEASRTIYLHHEDDFRNSRVKLVKAPVGHNKKPVITHRFIYESDKSGHPSKKTHASLSGRTHVYDAYLRKTTYEYNQEHRPISIKRYDENKNIYSQECYTWDDRYAFPSELFPKKKKDTRINTLSEIQSSLAATLSESLTPFLKKSSGASKKEQIEHLFKACLKSPLLQKGGEGNLLGKYVKDGEGHILTARFFEYDDRGNIKKDRLYGDLRGIRPQTIELNLHGQPIDNGCEYYEKRLTYSNDSYNLLQSEEEDNGKGVLYDYYPESDLVFAKYLLENGSIRLRQFSHYDANATLIKIVKDDGSEKGEDNWRDVTERHITYIEPTKTAPFGLPETIKHTFVDHDTQTEKLLKKIFCHYSGEGHLLQQDHYDADDHLRYSLFWSYDAHGNVTGHINAMGAEVIKEYDDNDNLICEKGPRAGDQKKYVYDFSNRLLSIQTEEKGTRWTVSYRYDLVGNRIAEIDRYGNTTKFIYDRFNRLIRTIYPRIDDQSKRPSKENIYDCLDRPIIETDARGYSTVKTYNARKKVTSILYPDGQCERFEYHLDGTLARKIASNGTALDFTYDYLGRLVHEMAHSKNGQFLYETLHTYRGLHKVSSKDAQGVTTFFEYDGAGRLIKTTCLEKVELFEYDSLGRLNKKKEPFGQGKMRVTCSEHDFLDRVIEERVEDEAGVILKKVQYRYDLLGNRTHVIEETEAGLSQHITDYNVEKKPIRTVDPAGNETHITYGSVKNFLDQSVLQSKTTDPLGRQSIITYDAMGHPINIRKQDRNGVLLALQDLFYDAEGNIIRVIDHVVVQGQEMKLIQTSFAYEEMGQLTRLTEAEGLPEQKITHIRYHSHGQKESVTKSDGTVLFYTYDPLGRLQTHRSGDGSIDYRYTYNLRHQILHVEDRINNAHLFFEYDLRGRLSTERLASGLSMHYNYDHLDRVVDLTLPDQSQVFYSYDAMHLKQIDRQKNQQSVYTHRYDTFDRSGLNLKSTAINQQETLFRFDLHKRAQALHHPSFKQHDIHYDEAGRLRHYCLEDSKGEVPIFFDFDDNDHLIKEEGHLRHTYACDSLHNRREKNAIPHQSNGLHQMIDNGEYTFCYDRSGNLKSKQKEGCATRYEYDALDRLISVKSAEEITRYVYDGFNRRIAKIKGNQTTRYLYTGQDEIGSIDEGGNVQELRILGQGHGAEIGASVAIELNDQIFAPVHDFQGNISALMNLAGDVVETYRYSAFGERLIYNCDGEQIAKSQCGNPWQFSGKRVDEESGFIYFGRRYYDPINGRWITPDPAGFADGPNLYAYLHHRPVQGFDLYGLQEEEYYPLQNVDVHEKAEPMQNKENDDNREAPLGFIEKKKTKKDCLFFCGVNQMSEISISWVNGIMNSLKDSSETAKVLSEMADDHYVTFVYNETRKFVGADLVRCFFELFFYANTQAVKNLQTRWSAHFNAAGPNSYLFHVCHSEGAIITRNALKSYPEELRQRIIVIAIAPGAYINDKYAYQVTHYRSTRDIVPLLDFVGAYRCSQSTVVLKPHPDAPWFDHSVSSPTYQDSLRFEVESYKEYYGGRPCAQAA